MRRYLNKSEPFESVEWRSEYAPDSLVCRYVGGWYPSSVDEASIRDGRPVAVPTRLHPTDPDPCLLFTDRETTNYENDIRRHGTTDDRGRGSPDGP